MNGYPAIQVTGAGNITEIRAAIKSGELDGEIYADQQVWVSLESLDHWQYMRATPVPAVAA